MKKKKRTPKEFNKQKKLEKNVRRSLDIEKSFKGNNKEEGRYYEEIYYNPAKSVSGNRSDLGTKKKALGNRKGNARKRNKKDVLGLSLAGLQGLISVVFMVMLFILDMLPIGYLGIIAVILLLLLGITLATQLRKRGRRIGGKVFSLFIMILLLFTTYYIGKAKGALGEISGGSYKVDNMVVAVLVNDDAEVIDDTVAYKFGVQYTMSGDDVRSAVADINEKLGTEIQTVEYGSLSEQAQALHDGQVQAIIYNEGYTGILEEAFENYSENVKVIYQHSIKKELDNTAAQVEVKKDTFSV